jgi:hypothetical protein
VWAQRVDVVIPGVGPDEQPCPPGRLQNAFGGQLAGRDASYWVMRVIHYPPLPAAARSERHDGAPSLPPPSSSEGILPACRPPLPTLHAHSLVVCVRAL